MARVTRTRTARPAIPARSSGAGRRSRCSMRCASGTSATGGRRCRPLRPPCSGDPDPPSRRRAVAGPEARDRMPRSVALDRSEWRWPGRAPPLPAVGSCSAHTSRSRWRSSSSRRTAGRSGAAGFTGSGRDALRAFRGVGRTPQKLTPDRLSPGRSAGDDGCRRVQRAPLRPCVLWPSRSLRPAYPGALPAE